MSNYGQSKTFINPKKVENKYLYIFDENDVFILGMLIGIFFVKIFFDRFKLVEPQFIFNIDGFKIENYDFMNWEDIYNEKVVCDNGQYFIFTLNNKLYKVPIHEINTTTDKFEIIVKTYRLRYENSRKLTE